MPLYPFVTLMPSFSSDPNILYKLMELLYQSEQDGRTWFIRPALLKSLDRIYKAYEQKKISGAFIFSNNGSDELVEFVAEFLNYCIWIKSGKTLKDIFKAAFSRMSPSRNGFGLIKNFQVIQKCLQDSGLPPCSSEQDLLFFDDLHHPLEQEIPNYVHVPAYFNQTEIHAVLRALHPLSVYFSVNDWKNLCKRAFLENRRDFARLDNRYLPNPQPLDEFVRDTRIFNKAYTQFFKRTRQTRKRSM